MTDGEKLNLVSQTRLESGCAAARAMWLKLGLPVVPEMLEQIRSDKQVDGIA